MVSHAVDYAVWGLRPFGHHLTSILLHGCNAALVVLLAVRLLQARGCALSRQGMLAAGWWLACCSPCIPARRVRRLGMEQQGSAGGLLLSLGFCSATYATRARRGRGRAVEDRRYLTTLLCFVLSC